MEPLTSACSSPLTDRWGTDGWDMLKLRPIWEPVMPRAPRIVRNPSPFARRRPWQTGDILLFFAPPWLHWK